MNILINVLLAVDMLVAVLMTLVILMQRPKSEGLGAAFGGGVTENIFGAQTTNVLVKFTGWLAGIFFVLTFVLGVLYAQRSSSDSALHKELMGMPTPAAAGMIAAVVHAFHRAGPLQDWRWSVVWLLMAAALGGLMVSTIRYYSFKDLPWSRKQPAFLILFLIILGALIWAFSEVVLVTFAGTYAVAGVILHLVRFIRQRMVSRTA